MSLITLRWQMIDHHHIDPNTLGENGLYMFVMRRCGHPYYVGTAEKRPLSMRLAEHDLYFRDGRRAYYTARYFARHQTPLEHWAARINEVTFGDARARAADVYVPGTQMTFDKNESLSFWRDRLRVIVAPLSGSSEVTLVKQIERSLQYRLEDELLRAYPHLKRADIRPAIPHSRSDLFGRREAAGPAVSFVHDWRALGGDFAQARKVLDTGEGYSTLPA